MAFNNGFPATYQQQIMQQPMSQQQMQQVQQPQIQQPVQQYPIVQGGFVRVMNENEARMYPVAPGNSVTFINESAPYCYTKTVNMGQLDRPVFEKYRLVKETDDNNTSQNLEQQPQKSIEVPQPDMSKYVTIDILDGFRADLDALRSELDNCKTDLYGIAGKKKTTIKKEVEPND